MAFGDDSFPLLLRRLRQRWWIASIGETVAVAIIAAIAASALAMFIGFSPVGPAVVSALIAGVWLWQSPRSLDEIAARLDDQHHLADLLGSAWGLRNRLNEPWAAQLWAMANARAATLPPPAWPGRFSVRQQTCGLAMAAALLLVTRLISPGYRRGGKRSSVGNRIGRNEPANSSEPSPTFTSAPAIRPIAPPSCPAIPTPACKMDGPIPTTRSGVPAMMPKGRANRKRGA